MALRKNTADAFEAFDADNQTVEATSTQETTTQKVSPSAVAVAQPQGALTAARAVAGNVISNLKDVFRVEYDSLPSIGASQGSFTLKDTDEDLGDSLTIQLISYQEQWVCSPNDKNAEFELVQYSDDGVNSRDGLNMNKHLEDLKAQGYKNAKIAHRLILVGELLETAKGKTDRVGELVQVNMPDTGRRSFNNYTIQASYAAGRGRITPEHAATLVLTAVREKSRSGDVYTKIVVSGK